jgi:hypothetical protein
LATSLIRERSRQQQPQPQQQHQQQQRPPSRPAATAAWSLLKQQQLRSLQQLGALQSATSLDDVIIAALDLSPKDSWTKLVTALLRMGSGMYSYISTGGTSKPAWIPTYDVIAQASGTAANPTWMSMYDVTYQAAAAAEERDCRRGETHADGCNHCRGAAVQGGGGYQQVGAAWCMQSRTRMRNDALR